MKIYLQYIVKYMNMLRSTIKYDVLLYIIRLIAVSPTWERASFCSLCWAQCLPYGSDSVFVLIYTYVCMCMYTLLYEIIEIYDYFYVLCF